jgi:hypothetical protein
MQKVYKRYGKSLGVVEFWRTKEWGYSGVQRSTTETRELELGVQKLYNKVRE